MHTDTVIPLFKIYAFFIGYRKLLFLKKVYLVNYRFNKNNNRKKRDVDILK